MTMDMDDGRVASQAGSREPSPAVSALMGFDPSRDDAVTRLREIFVHDYQYRFHRQSDHYSIVAMFALLVAKHTALAIEARSDATGTGAVEGESAGRQATQKPSADNGLRDALERIAYMRAAGDIDRLASSKARELVQQMERIALGALEGARP
jgi:hypothetical protein